MTTKDFKSLQREGRELGAVLIGVSDQVTPPVALLLQETATKIAVTFQSYDRIITHLLSKEIELSIKQDTITPTINAFKLNKITFQELMDELNKL